MAGCELPLFKQASIGTIYHATQSLLCRLLAHHIQPTLESRLLLVKYAIKIIILRG